MPLPVIENLKSKATSLVTSVGAGLRAAADKVKSVFALPVVQEAEVVLTPVVEIALESLLPAALPAGVRTLADLLTPDIIKAIGTVLGPLALSFLVKALARVPAPADSHVPPLLS